MSSTPDLDPPPAMPRLALPAASPVRRRAPRSGRPLESPCSTAGRREPASVPPWRTAGRGEFAAVSPWRTAGRRELVAPWLTAGCPKVVAVASWSAAGRRESVVAPLWGTAGLRGLVGAPLSRTLAGPAFLGRATPGRERRVVPAVRGESAWVGGSVSRALPLRGSGTSHRRRPVGRGGAGRVSRVRSARRVSCASSFGCVIVVVRTADLPQKGRSKIVKSNTVSIELPYDVVHHVADNFEEDSNNCLKMIFSGDTVAVCDIRTTDREVHRRGGEHERAG